MFSKKKTVPVLPRSRFIKPKPNLKVVPKNSQQNEKEKKHEESSNKPEISENDTPKITEEAFNNNTEKFTSLNQKNPEVLENVTPQISDETVSSNALKFPAEEENITSIEKYLSDSNTEKNTPKETLSKDSTLQTFNGNVSSFKHVNSSEKISNISLLETDSTFSSPAKENSESLIKKSLPFEHSNEVISEKLVNFSPAKFSSIDKRYPCITKLLSAPKKRSKNIEVRERKKMMASYKDLPPRSEMTFTDLIFWNPNTSPMKSKESKPGFVFNPKEKETVEEEREEEQEEEEDSVAPKLFVNENGEIILDESSLVVKRKKTNVDMTSEAIIIDDSNITYSSFRKRISKLWTPKETVKFYKALSVVGTDFALMENIMPNRTRRELKIKFKKEEKINMELLQRAMYETETFQTDLSIDDLNLDVIDIPGLEESIAKDLTDPDNGVKRQRGRPKKVKDKVPDTLSTSNLESQQSPKDTSVVISRGRGRPKKTIDKTPTDSPETENDLLVALIESDESSPLIRKRKVKVLSQDSLEENSAEDFFEIEVQVKSSKSNETQEENTTVSNSPDILTPSYVESASLDKIPKKQLAPKTSLVKHDHLKDILKTQKEKGSPSEIACTNRKHKRVKSNLNIESQENKNVLEESSDVLQSDSFPYPSSPNSIIEVTDEKLLSDGITDVVTSVHRKVTKRKYPDKSEQNNAQHRLQPSFKLYTPVDDLDTDCNVIKSEISYEPVFFKNPKQRKYGSLETKELKKKVASPVPSSPLVDNLSNLKSSHVSSLSMSCKEPITISVTPEQSENSNGLMLMSQSSEGNSLHFYVANHFTGTLALPPEITVPPVIKSEEGILLDE